MPGSSGSNAGGTGTGGMSLGHGEEPAEKPGRRNSAEPRLDVDEVFGRFTPRLRELAESSAVPDGTPGTELSEGGYMPSPDAKVFAI